MMTRERGWAGSWRKGSSEVLNDALDLKEALQVRDLEDTDEEQDARLEQRPPNDTRVCALGSYLFLRETENESERKVS